MTTLWLLNLKLIISSLAVIAFLTYGWIYFDLGRSSKKHYIKYYYVGAWLISLTLVILIVQTIISTPLEILDLFITFGFLIGTALIAAGVWLEEIPGKPETKKKPKKTKVKSISPILLLLPYVGSALISLSICYRLLKKATYGESKEFKTLLISWVSFTIYFSTISFILIGDHYLTWAEIITKDASIIWWINQVSLLIGSIMILRWVALFLSFRTTPRIFINLWILIIIFSTLLTSVYSVFTINSAENQLESFLTNNSRLIDFNLEQINQNNIELAYILTENDDVITAIKIQNPKVVRKELDIITEKNGTTDRIILNDNEGIVIYDTGRPDVSGHSLSNNIITKQSLLESRQVSGYMIEEQDASADRLTFQSTTPIYDENNILIGSVNVRKDIDDNYLDILKKGSNQEVILYTHGQRSASTVVESDNISRLENLPLNTILNDQNESQYTEVTILSTPYFIMNKTIKDPSGENIANLIIGTEQQILTEITRDALIKTFIVVIIFNLLAIIPCIVLAKDLNKNIKS